MYCLCVYVLFMLQGLPGPKGQKGVTVGLDKV